MAKFVFLWSKVVVLTVPCHFSEFFQNTLYCPQGPSLKLHFIGAIKSMSMLLKFKANRNYHLWVMAVFFIDECSKWIYKKTSRWKNQKAKPMLESCSTIKNCALFKQSLHTLVGRNNNILTWSQAPQIPFCKRFYDYTY